MRIGMIAMSGVRACDEKLMRLGLTLPGFVDRSRVIASLPSLGLLTLAGMTPKEHDLTYIEVDEVDPTALPEFDLVAISTFTAQANESYRIADLYRARGAQVVIGGLHATAMPDDALEHADAVVAGEGELCWHRVLRDAEANRLAGAGPGVYRSQPDEFDFARSPMPAFERLDINRYNRLTVQTSRGCPWRCEFCASSILLTNKYKQKPIERVLAEIDRIRELWPKPFIEFADDNSFVNRRYWKRLLPQLAMRRIRWFTETDISVAEDEELLDLMRQAGCEQVLIGLESPDATGLDGLEARRNWKLTQLDTYASAVRRIQSRGIRVNGCFIVGLDGHTPEVFDRVYDYARELELYDVQVTLPTPFPGTAMYERLRAAGRLHDDRAWHRMTLFDLTFEPDPMSADELVAGFRDLVKRLYGEEITRWRRENFHHNYLWPSQQQQPSKLARKAS